MTGVVRFLCPPTTAWRELERLGLHQRIISAHRKPTGRHPHGQLHCLVEVDQ